MTTKATTAPEGRGYAQADWDQVSDNPEWTAEEMARAQPFSEVLPELAASARRVRGKQKAPTKQLVSLRLDRSIIEAFKAEGAGWQRRINEALRHAVGAGRAASAGPMNQQSEGMNQQSEGKIGRALRRRSESR